MKMKMMVAIFMIMVKSISSGPSPWEHHNCQELLRISALDDDDEEEEEDDLDDITTLMLSGPSPAASSLSKVNEQRCTFQICHSDIGKFAAQRWTR